MVREMQDKMKQDNICVIGIPEGEKEEHRYTGDGMAMNNYLSIITLNMNGSNAPVKRHRVVEWIRKHDL